MDSSMIGCHVLVDYLARNRQTWNCGSRQNELQGLSLERARKTRNCSSDKRVFPDALTSDGAGNTEVQELEKKLS